MLKLKSTSNRMPLLMKAIIAAQVVVFIGLVWMVVALVGEIKERGIKDIAQEIWCGQDLECRRSLND